MSEHNRRTMTVKELAEYLGIGYIKAYELTILKDFPMFKVGKKILIIRSKVDEWLENTAIGQQF